MKRATRPKARIEPIQIQYEDVDIGFAAMLVTNANSLRITVPANTVRLYQLMAGDMVQVKILRVSRTKPKQFGED